MIKLKKIYNEMRIMDYRGMKKEVLLYFLQNHSYIIGIMFKGINDKENISDPEFWRKNHISTEYIMKNEELIHYIKIAQKIFKPYELIVTYRDKMELPKCYKYFVIFPTEDGDNEECNSALILSNEKYF